MHIYVYLYEKVSSNEISLCLCEIRICLFLIFEFAKLPDNNIKRFNFACPQSGALTTHDFGKTNLVLVHILFGFLFQSEINLLLF